MRKQHDSERSDEVQVRHESRGVGTASFRSSSHKQHSYSATCYVVKVMQEKSDYIVVNLFFIDVNSILE